MSVISGKSVASRRPFQQAFRPARQCGSNRPQARVRAKFIEDDEDLEEQVAKFLAEQDISERGMEGPIDTTKVVGQDLVDDETAKAYCRDIIRVLRALKKDRDMEFNEVKLIVQVDDPRNDDIRKMGMETSSGVSRDEMAVALQQVADGQLPGDRLALKVLHDEITNWPYLDAEAASAERRSQSDGERVSSLPAPDTAAPGLPQAERLSSLANQPLGPRGRDPKDRPQGVQDMLPEWMGYGAVYFFTIIPVLIFGGTVAILFFSSLK